MTRARVGLRGVAGVAGVAAGREGEGEVEGEGEAALSSAARHSMAVGRSAGDLARQRATRSSSQGGTAASRVCTRGAGSRSMAMASATALSPRNGRVPVSSSNSRTPNENMSVLSLTGSPLLCSGDM